MSQDSGLSLGRVPGQLPAPPPSPALLRQVSGAGPVRTRVPWQSLLLVALAALAYPLYTLAILPLRPDLPGLPALWFVAVGLLWSASFVGLLALALLPRPGQVLPGERRAGAAAVLATLTLILTGLLFTVDVPGATIVPPPTSAAFAHAWWHCISFSAGVVLPVIGVGLLALRRFCALGLWRLGAALGAAGGALAGLTLHGICPIGGGLHVGLAHGGAVALAGLLGAAVMKLMTLGGQCRNRRRQRS